MGGAESSEAPGNGLQVPLAPELGFLDPRPILDVGAREGIDAELDAAREREIEARLQVETARESVRAASWLNSGPWTQ